MARYGKKTEAPEAPTAPESTFISKDRMKEILAGAQSQGADPEIVFNELANAGHKIEGYNSDFDWSNFAGNIVPSALELGKGVFATLKNPMQTVAGLGSVISGIADKILPEALSRRGELSKALSPKTTDVERDAHIERDNQVVSMIADHYVERYGGLGNALNTIEKDPAGFLADVATVTGVAGGAVKTAGNIGAKAGILSARTASALTRTGETLARTANAIDPINIAAGNVPFVKENIYAKAIRRANEKLGVTKLLKDADVNERMLYGLGLTGAQRVKLAENTKVAKGGEQLAKWGVTGTLDEMSERLDRINKGSSETIDKTLERLSKPEPAAKVPATRTPSEIDADILRRTEQLELQGATAEQLANDPVLQRLDQESLSTYAQNAKRPAAPQPTTFKVNDADHALDQIYDLNKAGTEKLADLVKPVDERIAQTLDLNPKETYQIVNKTQTGAGDIGKRLTGMGVEPDDTLANISKKSAGAAKTSQSTLDKALAGIGTRFTTKTTTKVLESLKDLKSSIPYTKLAEPLQKEYNRIIQLLARNENKGLTLSELNETKRLLDNVAGDKIFTLAGDIKTSEMGKNLASLRQDLRATIEKGAAKAGVKNVRELNNQTQFAQEVKSIVDKKIKSGLPKPEVTSTANTSVESQALRGRLKDLREKSVTQGLNLSELNEVDKLITKISPTAGKGRSNLENLQKNIRQVIDTQAERRGVNNIDKLRSQRDVSAAYKQVIDRKILAGGDKVNIRNIGKLATQTLFSEMLYRSKIGKVYGLLKGVKGFFQTVRSPQFQRDMATAIQMLNDSDFAKLEGGLNIPRRTTELEAKLARRATREKTVAGHVEVMNKVLKNLSEIYPTLRGVRVTGEALRVAEKKQKTQQELDAEPVVQNSNLTPQNVNIGATGAEFENAGQNVILGVQ